MKVIFDLTQYDRYFTPHIEIDGIIHALNDNKVYRFDGSKIYYIQYGSESKSNTITIKRPIPFTDNQTLIPRLVKAGSIPVTVTFETILDSEYILIADIIKNNVELQQNVNKEYISFLLRHAYLTVDIPEERVMRYLDAILG